ncbi:hypothetical protein CAPTEDRAFT_223268 [Capitella teleta]|uniref:tRNA(Phe) (4-demethylwyosine(37)-C(7)) aminocarboxypropyltransferase n=1 Tax=Capitella teleta TaxID=283909 RepID=R7UTZ6_CAPTE|nr:hypothetical protein CAPTEDRAFT_223268 [Capitella teleta]|eukprot:ELU07407.1 hypothetical protein CAPTEDRAFT_223268 [Capitella teleta]
MRLWLQNAAGFLVEIESGLLIMSNYYDNGKLCFNYLAIPYVTKKQCPREKLIHALRLRLEDHTCNYTWASNLELEVPRHWEKHGDLIILPQNAFRNPIWSQIGAWALVTEHLKCNRVARKSVVKNDKFRTPQVELVVGENGWIQQIDNHIKFTYNVTKCMFSVGNITEKLRIASWNCSDETVVDLYAGIGYFTLPYLVHANAKHVFACEWNPDAVEALQRNLILNQVHDRCTVLPGDNAKVCPKAVAHRVNLGLIPSSESGWRTACRALRGDAVGFLHIHMNLESGQKQLIAHSKPTHSRNEVKCERILWVNETCEKIKNFLEEEHGGKWKTHAVHLEHVKSYAPHVDHVVLDMRCEPK